VFDHTSSLQLLEHFVQKRFGKNVREDNISSWRRAVAGDLTSVFRPWQGEALTAPKFLDQREWMAVITRAKLERRGNAAFVGMIRETLVDSSGAVHALQVGDSVVRSYQSPLGVYHTMEPRLATAIARPALARGRYWLRYEVVAEREDLDPKVVLKAPAVRDSVQVMVP